MVYFNIGHDDIDYDHRGASCLVAQLWKPDPGQVDSKYLLLADTGQKIPGNSVPGKLIPEEDF